MDSEQIKNPFNEGENPLKSHFRTPSLYLSLPTKGAFYDESVFDNPESGEIPIYSMTARDEIMLQAPDALMNGEATRSVIQSCAPNFKNGYRILSPDLDAVLIAIRIATYGEQMDFDSVCPECNNTDTYAIDLRFILDKIKFDQYITKIVVNENISVFIKPKDYQSINNMSIQSYEEEKMMRVLQNTEMDEEQKKIKFQTIFNRMLKTTLESIIDQIDRIEVDDIKVKYPQHIEEYLNNTDKKTYDSIRDAITKLNQSMEIESIDIKCTECEHQYQTRLSFESSHFFGKGS